MRALMIIDVQYDFTAGGALEVPGGSEVIPVINELQPQFPLVIATQDWHPRGHKSFASSHPGKKPFDQIMLDGLKQVLWPDHCIQGTPGAAIHSELKLERVEAVFRKGMDVNIDSYSGLYDNGHKKSTGVAGYLRERAVEEVYVCGLAGDYCVYFTALDLLKEGFRTMVIEDATRSISPEGFAQAKNVLTGMRGQVIESKALI